MSKPAPKYRSAHRDKPRVAHALDAPRTKPAPGTLLYHTGAPLLSEMLAEAKLLNRRTLLAEFSDPIKAANDCLDALHRFASEHAWTFSSPAFPELNPAHDVIFSCFHKTLLSLHCAQELSLDGLYGPARPHLRHSFESMMIAKYCSCDPESDVFDRWIDGMDLYFTNGVLKKIVRPDISQFQESWSLLSDWTHATVYANQLSLDLETTRYQAGVNLAFIGVLIEFLDHLLTSHLLTPSIRYYESRYGNGLGAAQARVRLRQSLAPLRAIRGPGSSRLVKDFRAKWHLK